MSVEEEVELKDLIAQTLKSNGTLAKIKAQLRASIYLTLDEDEKISKQKPLLNNKIKSFVEGDEGRAMFYIVHEFLEFFDLRFTLAVYEPESYLEYNFQQDEKQRLLSQFGIGNNEDNNEPVLYQLIKIAQKCKRNLEINVNGNLPQENKSDSILRETGSISVPEIVCSENNSDEVRNKFNDKLKNGKSEHSLNTTFDVHSPLYSKHGKSDTQEPSAQNNETINNFDHAANKKQSEDTYEDTSSLGEDVDLVSQNNNGTVPEIKVNGIEETEISKISSSEKPKISPPKSDKLKSKSNLSSLSDLPPLNKSRVSDILPSLYNKDFRDKSNLRELDKLFDMDAEYEEDFMYSGDDLSIKSDHNSVNLLEELQQSNKTNKEKTAILSKKEVKPKSPSRIIPDCKFKTSVSSPKSKAISDISETSSVSENLESTSESV